MERATGSLPLLLLPQTSPALASDQASQCVCRAILKLYEDGAWTTSLVTYSAAWLSSGWDCFSLQPAWSTYFNLCPLHLKNWSSQFAVTWKPAWELFIIQHTCKNGSEDTHCVEDSMYLFLAVTAENDYTDADLRLTGNGCCTSKYYVSFYLFVWIHYEHFASTDLSVLFPG